MPIQIRVGLNSDHGLRKDYLAAVGRPHDARRAIDGAAEVIVVTLDDTRVQSTAHVQRDPVGRFGIGDCLLQLQGGADRIKRILERSVDPSPVIFTTVPMSPE